MINLNAFDPDSGAPLSETRYRYPDAGYPSGDTEATFSYADGRFSHAARTPVNHPDVEWSASREGALTNGELHSSARGLLGYFRRIHRKVRAPQPEMDRAAACAIKRIRSERRTAWDCYVWYALAERLAAKGYWVAWMLDYVEPRCPYQGTSTTHCGSDVKFRPATSVERGGTYLEAVCASSPHEHGVVDDAICEHVGAIYTETFDDDFDPVFL